MRYWSASQIVMFWLIIVAIIAIGVLGKMLYDKGEAEEINPEVKITSIKYACIDGVKYYYIPQFRTFVPTFQPGKSIPQFCEGK